MHMERYKAGPVVGAWTLCHANGKIQGRACHGGLGSLSCTQAHSWLGKATMVGNGKERGGLRGKINSNTDIQKTDIKHGEGA